MPAPPATRANLLDSVEVGLGVLDDVVDFVGDQGRPPRAATWWCWPGCWARSSTTSPRTLARAQAALGDATGVALDTLRETVAAGERLLTDAVDAVEDMAEEAAEQGEEIVDALVDGVRRPRRYGRGHRRRRRLVPRLRTLHHPRRTTHYHDVRGCAPRRGAHPCHHTTMEDDMTATTTATATAPLTTVEELRTAKGALAPAR